MGHMPFRGGLHTNQRPVVAWRPVQEMDVVVRWRNPNTLGLLLDINRLGIRANTYVV
jgi:hypothetical protein